MSNGDGMKTMSIGGGDDAQYGMVGGSSGGPGSSNSSIKQGHICCGGCCDVRRATIIVNSIMIVITLLGMLGLEATTSLMENVAQDADDDVTKQAAEDLSSLPIGLMIFFMFIEMICFGLGIYGAMKYKEHFVLVSLVCYSIMFVINLYNLQFAALIQIGFFAYPHVYLIKEIKAGIMSEANYPNEAQSCCCV